MQNLWTDEEANSWQGDLALRVFSSRLLGRDPTLVLHGGGNTSVKIREQNIFGEQQDILYVKGSGWDLIDIEEAGFAPVELEHTRRLAELPALPDPQMVNELKTHMKNAAAPTPSVEAILHAIMPFKYVDHTHANAVLTITNSVDGEKHIKQIYGDKVVIVPYCMPGFDLAGVCKKHFDAEATDKTIGMILLNHGVFSFGETAKQSYDRMIELVSMAEDFLKQQNAWQLPSPENTQPPPSDIINIATLRKQISEVARQAMLLKVYNDPRSLQFVQRDDLDNISQQGPVTPDHVIRTKRLPMLGQDIEAYTDNYQQYFATHSVSTKSAVTMLDPAPRVIIDKNIGVCAIGQTAAAMHIVGDIYQHSMDVIERAEKLGGYRALPAQDVFAVEYWDLEQAKLKKGGQPPIFTGEVVCITGAASGIGEACVDAYLKRGAAVVGLDINAAITDLRASQQYLGLQCDVTDLEQLKNALNKCVHNFGGLDMLVLNAGIFPGGCRIEDMQLELWQKVLDINLTSNLALIREALPLLKLAPNGGRVVVMGSKNVPAPGPGAAAYSASKAALNQLSRIAALEWGADNIRINTLHPDAVFDTAIWTDKVLQARADHYGMTIQEYKTKNILKTEITSKDVAELAAETCGPLFAKTTGAQIPVDGGNDRVI